MRSDNNNTRFEEKRLGKWRGERFLPVSNPARSARRIHRHFAGHPNWMWLVHNRPIVSLRSSGWLERQNPNKIWFWRWSWASLGMAWGTQPLQPALSSWTRADRYTEDCPQKILLHPDWMWSCASEKQSHRLLVLVRMEVISPWRRKSMKTAPESGRTPNRKYSIPMPFAYVTMALSQPVNIRTERSSLFAFFEVSHLHNYCEPTRRQCSDPTLPAATIRSSNISSSRFKASLKFVGPLKSKNAVKTIYFSFHTLR